MSDLRLHAEVTADGKAATEELTASLSEWAQWRALPDEQAAETLKNLVKLATHCAGKILEPFIGSV